MIITFCRSLISHSIPATTRLLSTKTRGPLTSQVHSLAAKNFSRIPFKGKLIRNRFYAYQSPPPETSIPKIALGGAVWGFSFAGGKFVFDNMVSSINDLKKTKEDF